MSPSILVFGQLLIKNSASALEVIWLQYSRPSQLKGETFEIEINGVNELPDGGIVVAGADTTGEDVDTVGADGL